MWCIHSWSVVGMGHLSDLKSASRTNFALIKSEKLDAIEPNCYWFKWRSSFVFCCRWLLKHFDPGNIPTKSGTIFTTIFMYFIGRSNPFISISTWHHALLYTIHLFHRVIFVVKNIRNNWVLQFITDNKTSLPKQA